MCQPGGLNGAPTWLRITLGSRLYCAGRLDEAAEVEREADQAWRGNAGKASERLDRAFARRDGGAATAAYGRILAAIIQQRAGI